MLTHLVARCSITFAALLGASFTVPFEAKAQPVVGPASPSGGVGLAGDNNNPSIGETGNPLQFDQTLQFNGLTATGEAQTAYTFGALAQAAGAGGKLSVSGSITPGLSNASATLSIGATLANMFLGPAPPEGVDYFYNIGPSSTLVTGMLAPGDKAFILVESFATDYYGKFSENFFSDTITNTTSEIMPIYKFEQFSGAYLGDWYYVRQSNVFANSVTTEVEIMISKAASSSSEESWIDVDPTYGMVETTTLSVPEPTSLIPFGIGLVTLAGYSWYRFVLFPGKTTTVVRVTSVGKQTRAVGTEVPRGLTTAC
ncbi:MAG: hypothetical protein ACLQGP_33940 [Isosphaeraceae bacterium]